MSSVPVFGLGRCSNAGSTTTGVGQGTSFITSLAEYGVALPRERFVDPVSDAMLCLLCGKVSPDPVYLLCCYNKYYCYKCLVPERRESLVLCPSCENPTNPKTLTRNDNLRVMIYNLKVKCEFADSGCDKLSTIDTISDHVDQCVYQPSPCENPDCDVICLFKNWVWHCKVQCPKRQTQCVGTCHKFISADQIDSHDCDNVLKGLLQYQHDEIEILSKLLKDQHEEHISRGPSTLDTDLSTRIAERLIIRDATKKDASESLANLKLKLKLMNVDDDVHDELGHEIHSGDWRCSVIECELPYKKHDYTKVFPDGNRHIFFWDCCLDHTVDSKQCDLYDDLATEHGLD